MPIDPVSAAIAASGMFLNRDADARARDAAQINAQKQEAFMMANAGAQNQFGQQAVDRAQTATGEARSRGDELTALIEQMIANQRDEARASGVRQNTAATDLGNRDISTAHEGQDSILSAARGSRMDAYGNSVDYDPTRGGFVTNLTAPQQDIMRGTQTNQKSMSDALNEALAELRFNKGPSEEAIRGELTQLLSQQNADEGSDRANVLSMQSQRLGRGASIPQILKAIDDSVGGKLPNTLLQARQGGLTEYNTREDARIQRLIPTIAQLMTPIKTPDSLSGITAMSNDAASGLTDAAKSGAGLVQGATKGASDRSMSTLSDTDAKYLATLIGGDNALAASKGAAADRVAAGQGQEISALQNWAKQFGTNAIAGANAENEAAKNQTTANTKLAPDFSDIAKLYSSFSGGKMPATDNKDLIKSIMKDVSGSSPTTAPTLTENWQKGLF